MAGKFPYLRKEKLEAAANDLLDEFASKNGLPLVAPIPVEDILEKHLGLTLEIDDLSARLKKKHVLGAICIDENLVLIDESLLGQEGRYAFTIAHEIGHWQLHRQIFLLEREMPTLFDDEKPPSIVCRDGAKAPEEFQANTFAAALLMPRQLMLEFFRRLSSDGPLDATVDQRAGYEGACWMIEQGGFTNCSKEAMQIRMKELGMVTCSGQQRLL